MESLDVTDVPISHPYIAHRKSSAVALTAGEHVGFNGWLAATMTKAFGSMWAFYALVFWMFTWMFLATTEFWLFRNDQYPFTFLLFLSNLVQLWALPVLAVGQQVLSRVSDKQAIQTYQDAEALLELTDNIQVMVKANSRLTVEINKLVQINNKLTAEIHHAVSGGVGDGA